MRKTAIALALLIATSFLLAQNKLKRSTVPPSSDTFILWSPEGAARLVPVNSYESLRECQQVITDQPQLFVASVCLPANINPNK